MKAPDTVSFATMLQVLKDRTSSVEIWPGNVQRKTRPGYCDCPNCKKDRIELEADIKERHDQLTCTNVQYKPFCQLHQRYFHLADWCPDCGIGVQPPLVIQHNGIYYLKEGYCFECLHKPCRCYIESPRFKD